MSASATSAAENATAVDVLPTVLAPPFAGTSSLNLSAIVAPPPPAGLSTPGAFIVFGFFSFISLIIPRNGMKNQVQVRCFALAENSQPQKSWR